MGLAFAVEIDDPFAETDREFEVLKKVKSKQTIDAALGRKIVAEDIEIRNFLADRRRGSDGCARSILNAASGDDALPVKGGIGRVVAEARHDVGRQDGQARTGVEHDRNDHG